MQSPFKSVSQNPPPKNADNEPFPNHGSNVRTKHPPLGWRRRGFFLGRKTAVGTQNNPKDAATDGSVSPIKNSAPGNRMAGEMKESPGNHGFPATLPLDFERSLHFWSLKK
jgi:hypothetical protein